MIPRQHLTVSESGPVNAVDIIHTYFATKTIPVDPKIANFGAETLEHNRPASYIA